MPSTMKEFLDKALNEGLGLSTPVEKDDGYPLGKQTTYERIKKWRKFNRDMIDNLEMLKESMTKSNQAMVVKTYTERMKNTIKRFEKTFKKMGIE